MCGGSTVLSSRQAKEVQSLVPNTPAVKIRPATQDDHELLVRVLGQADYFRNRLGKQENGKGVLLTAWLDAEPVGAVYLWLEPAEESDIRSHLPGVPLLTHLEVVAAHRNRGIGTQLIAATEVEAAQRGHDQIALAVGINNWDAERLYKHLDYRPWGHGPVECSDEENRIESCRVLVKNTRCIPSGPAQTVPLVVELTPSSNIGQHVDASAGNPCAKPEDNRHTTEDKSGDFARSRP